MQGSGTIDYAAWSFRVLAWDGLLPVIIIFLPGAIEVALPGNRGALEIASIILPIAAFFFRAWSGLRHIRSNHCGPDLRGFQTLVFFVGIFPLVLFDAFIILTHLMPPGQFRPGSADFWVMAGIFGTYFLMMIIAMYPGRRPPEGDAMPMDWEAAG